jgi:hypothetical protein
VHEKIVIFKKLGLVDNYLVAVIDAIVELA